MRCGKRQVACDRRYPLSRAVEVRTLREMARPVATETRRAPAVVQGTITDEQARTLEEQFAALDVDPRLWSGAFATNVWGGRYAIEGVLGEGAQGTTFAGTDLKTGARIAVKVFDLG